MAPSETKGLGCPSEATLCRARRGGETARSAVAAAAGSNDLRPDCTTLPGYVDQRSTDLTFYFFDSAAPRGVVRVLAERTIDLPGGRISLAIIGSSHFLEIETGGRLLCEMLACPRPGLDRLPGHAETIGARDGSHWVEERETLSYRFDLWRHRCSPTEFQEEVALLALPGPGRLRYAFPSSDEAGSAVTCLEWQLEGRSATLATYHTFPGELTIVHTRSVIDFACAEA